MTVGSPRVGIFGGTFDPIHLGHTSIALSVAERFGLQEVLMIPAGNPPHKSGTSGVRAPYPHRLRMVEIACEPHPVLQPSDLEAGEAKSYSIDTIMRVAATEAPGTELLFIIGADAFAEIGTWYRWREVLSITSFVVVSRPGHDYEVPEGAEVYRFEDLAIPTSSSRIREQLSQGERPVDLDERVFTYIREKNLYLSIA